MSRRRTARTDLGSGDGVVKSNSNSGLVVENCTFNGGNSTGQVAFVNGGGGQATVIDNSFTNAPSHDVDIDSGVVENNYFSGGRLRTQRPRRRNRGLNDIWRCHDQRKFHRLDKQHLGSDQQRHPYHDGRGDTSNVTVTNNIVVGGSWSIYAQPTASVVPSSIGPAGTWGTFSNVNNSNNYVGFGQYGAFYPGPGWRNAVEQDGVRLHQPGILNQSLDHVSRAWCRDEITNPIDRQRHRRQPDWRRRSLAAALRAFTLGGSNSSETVFIGGAGTQYEMGGAGAISPNTRHFGFVREWRDRLCQ